MIFVAISPFSFSLQHCPEGENVVPKDDFTSRQGTFSAGGVFSAASLRAERLRGAEDRPPLWEAERSAFSPCRLVDKGPIIKSCQRGQENEEDSCGASGAKAQSGMQMTEKKALVPLERIESQIYLLRGQKVMIDADLASLYGVTTKRLNEQIKRNKTRFPVDFVFQLTEMEKQELVAKCDHLSRLKFSHALPYAFTEHGAIMAASVLNSDIAVEMSIYVVRAFVRLRRLLATHADLARKINALEKKYDDQFKIVFEAIRGLMMPPEPKKKRRIGF